MGLLLRGCCEINPGQMRGNASPAFVAQSIGRISYDNTGKPIARPPG